MSIFICLAVPSKVKIGQYIRPPFETEDVTETAIGASVVGGKLGARAYLVVLNLCSTDIVHPTRRYPSAGGDFQSAMCTPVREGVFPSIMLHWGHDVYLAPGGGAERVCDAKRMVVTLEEYLSLFPKLEYDVRYVLKP